MKDKLYNLALGLWPPQSGDEAVDNWRRNVAITLGGLTACMMFVVLGMTGGLKVVGFSGYALQVDLVEVLHAQETVNEGLKELRVWTLEENISANLALMCRAELENNKAAMSLAAQRGARFINNYTKLTGQKPYLPTCNQLN